MRNVEFKILYDKYHKFSASIIYQIVKDRSETEDICNDVFYQLYKMGARLDVSDELKLRAFIGISSKNRALDHLKKSYVRHEQTVMDDVNHWEEIPDNENNPEEVILHMEKASYQKMILARLREKNPINYDIFIKVKYLGMSTDDIAEEYGYTRNNVNNRIFRTKNWLMEELNKIYKE